MLRVAAHIDDQKGRLQITRTGLDVILTVDVRKSRLDNEQNLVRVDPSTKVRQNFRIIRMAKEPKGDFVARE